MSGTSPHLYTFDNTEDLAQRLRTYVLHSQNAALKRYDVFRVAVSGGSLPTILAKAFVGQQPSSATEAGGDDENTLKLSHWDIFFADERVVPLDHPDSNYNLVKTEFVDKLSPTFGQPKIHPIDTTDLSNGTDPQDIADLYQEELMHSFAAKDSVKLPVFDLILLGCGPDGHTCSLFPGHELLKESDSWVAAISDSPKPPPKRITLTLPVVTHGLRIAFVATGEGKKEVMKQIFDTEEGKQLPCGMVNEKAGDRVSWFTDGKATEGVAFPRKGNL
uniref:6-phosphogluconolactonase n=1 Tax=Coccidioides posadasii RMSCC 3488 TaxID=454284 RepID=A0A0J6FN63_COCPO|nr:6-phosphogluconolactonase [Coccidioides posadasii RMSCC 3488]